MPGGPLAIHGCCARHAGIASGKKADMRKMPFGGLIAMEVTRCANQPPHLMGDGQTTCLTGRTDGRTISGSRLVEWNAHVCWRLVKLMHNAQLATWLEWVGSTIAGKCRHNSQRRTATVVPADIGAACRR